ncbi:type I polyketide synthase [Saccharomonospora halophila]|uniref:type I polyketide synthase n=1 Tax=Saccharomonospora halophila TaxID=129922 RepID=UPI000372EAE0|nr:type I polyketide synthase [Saccharomonospora halophila]
MRSERIAIVGIGLRYPDSASPAEFWDNVLAGRRAFRPLPDERMRRDDYWSPDPTAPDRFYSTKAAVLRDYEFDRAAYRVAGSTYRSTDTTHWLALDVAARALQDAGFPDAAGLPGESTGVVLGNSLAGEFSRANMMRLRWPYVRRTVAAALLGKGWTEAEVEPFLAELETTYKAPFPPIDEDSLAGGLSNTIAGRICNYFDLGGGGYTVDGACSSSLLSVITAAKALSDGDLDAVLAGGVDLSIDPFEVIGFAKTGALATHEMKVYDRDSNGFWPGEGAGVLVLVRESDALAQGLRIYGSLAGWGISSDGKGGITRPESIGHRRALARAYDRAGYPVGTVSYFEGHGTGTALGDATEIEALSSAYRAGGASRPAALSSVKANIGHTKAAAGVAGLIKAVLAVHHQTIPPATGSYVAHPALDGSDAALYVPSSAEVWPADEEIRAGVSAMGFGGINTHLAVAAAPGTVRRGHLDEPTLARVAGRQDAEVLLFGAETSAGLRERVAEVAELAPKLAYAELTDLAAALAERTATAERRHAYRAAVVATDPEHALRSLNRVMELLDAGTSHLLAPQDGVFLSHGTSAPDVTFLFPGQGSGTGAAGALARRFPSASAVIRDADLPVGGDQVNTEVAQPRIVAGSLAALSVLDALGITAETAVGHSLGELTALHWSGALDAGDLLDLATVRGRVMARAGSGGGAMAGLATDAETAATCLKDTDAVIAGYNGPEQTVVSGSEQAVAAVVAAASAAGVSASRINVSHAFHSPLVAPAATGLAEQLEVTPFRAPRRTVVSTVTGAVLDPATDLRALLRDQVVSPVRFDSAATAVDSDLMIEVGPGRVLSGLVSRIAPTTPALALDSESDSLLPLLRVVGAVYALGVPVATEPLFAGRVVRPLPLSGGFRFLTNPCETAPDVVLGADTATVEAPPVTGHEAAAPAEPADGTFELLRRLAADRVELPEELIDENTHPLDDLHLSSITVGQLVNDATRSLGRPAPTSAPNFATARLGELATMLDELSTTEQGGTDSGPAEVTGVAPWVRPFAVRQVAAPVPAPAPVEEEGTGDWAVFAPEDHPLARPLREALTRAGVAGPDGGVLLCLPADGTDHTGLGLAAAKAALSGSRFVVVQQNYGAAGIARTVHLEAPTVATTVVGLADVLRADPEALADSVERVVTEVRATTGYAEARYGPDGTRTVPTLELAEPRDGGKPPLGAGDVLLVTGGGKGITAECALAVAQRTGVALALLGRSAPEDDAELAANLTRMDTADVRYRYVRTDITSADDVARAVAEIGAALGPVTGVLHGAGRNEPAAVPNLTEQAFDDAVAPKVRGLRAVLSAVRADRLKVLVTFGSIIGRAGLRGEAHYATANDWVCELTETFAAEHPDATVLALEWSVWSGAGMGERLGVVEALVRDGITPISTDDGIAMLLSLLSDPVAGPVAVVSGRAAGLPTLSYPSPEPPLWRFLDRILVHYGGVELVAEIDLGQHTDRYLDDHNLDGNMLLPAVVGMEAMAQAALAVTGRHDRVSLEDVELSRPVVVAPGATTTVRVAALVRGADEVDVVLRSAETGFHTDHFRARVRLGGGTGGAGTASSDGTGAAASRLPPLAVDPDDELYGDLLFQGERFQRLRRYRVAAARRAVGELATGGTAAFFAGHLPQERVLADPGARDAVMHALQCCVPDATLLPQRIERLDCADPAAVANHDEVVFDARERGQDGDSYTYDVDVRSTSGELLERWTGLVLRAVRKRSGDGPWVSAMLGPYLERSLERVLGGTRAVVVEPSAPQDTDRRARTGRALGRALGEPVTVRYRPDGKPEVPDTEVSASHVAGLTLAVAGRQRLSCDAETVEPDATRDWVGLLGAPLAEVADLISAETGEPRDVSATRVWTSLECLHKAGSLNRALTLETCDADGWVVLSSGDDRIATRVTTVRGIPRPVVFAFLAGLGN